MQQNTNVFSALADALAYVQFGIRAMTGECDVFLGERVCGKPALRALGKNRASFTSVGGWAHVTFDVDCPDFIAS